MKDKIIISICGAAGSGKSELAKQLVKTLGSHMALRIPCDYFLKSVEYNSFDEFISTPFKWDWKLLKNFISHPISTIGSIPEYDFNKFTRISKTGGIELTIRRYIFLDSTLPYPESSHIILLETPPDLRMQRLKERDKKWNSNVVKNWDKLELTAKSLKEKNIKFDQTLNGSLAVEENVNNVVAILKSRKILS
jgi:uridine kinase